MRATTWTRAPALPPPVYAPEVVADAILRCAERRVREITVGGGGRMMAVMGKMTPRTMDKYMEQTMFEQQKDSTGTVISQDSLYEPKEDGHAQGPYSGHVMQSSLYTEREALECHARAAIYRCGRGAGRYRQAVEVGRRLSAAGRGWLPSRRDPGAGSRLSHRMAVCGSPASSRLSRRCWLRPRRDPQLNRASHSLPSVPGIHRLTLPTAPERERWIGELRAIKAAGFNSIRLPVEWRRRSRNAATTVSIGSAIS